MKEKFAVNLYSVGNKLTYLLLLRSPNPVLQSGNVIIQTGIVSPVSRPRIQKLL